MVPIRSSHTHSYLDPPGHYKPFADAPQARSFSYARRVASPNCGIPSTADFEIQWPILDKYIYEELEEEVERVYQGSLPQPECDREAAESYGYNYTNSQLPTVAYADLSTLQVPPSPSISCCSEFEELYYSEGTMKARPAPTPPPLVISMSAFKKDTFKVPPAPPPSPIWTPPPSPPFCPRYEEQQTLSAYDTPIITSARHIDYIRHTPPSSAGLSKSPTPSSYSFSDESTRTSGEEYRAFDFEISSYGAAHDTEYEPAPAPPSISLNRTTSQPPASLQVPHNPTSSATITSSRSSSPSPTGEEGHEKGGPSISFFEWDAEPEYSAAATQWSKFKGSKSRDKRRGSDSNESQSGKSSVRRKAGRLCKKIEVAFTRSR